MGRKYFDDRYIINSLIGMYLILLRNGREQRPAHWCVCVVAGEGDWVERRRQWLRARGRRALRNRTLYTSTSPAGS